MARGYGPKTRTAKDKRTAAISMLLFRPEAGQAEVDLLMRCYGQNEAQARQLVAEEKARRDGP